MLWKKKLLICFCLIPATAFAQSRVVLGGGELGRECSRRAELSVQFNVAEPEDVEICSEALTLESASPKHRAALFVNRGVLLAATQQLEAAELSYKKALDLSDDIGETHINIGNLYLAQKHYQKALDHYTTAIPLMKRKLHVAYLNRGLAYEYVEDFSSAMADYERALVESPEWLKAKKLYARAKAKVEQ